ncbi:MAG: hypothetical protein K6A69_01215 [Lachnospiraceae bacterium]|nr:hypothetical protein [Lachnospiraceae bacterium]
MITYEEALKIAQERKSHKITACVECEKAYIFSVALPEGIESADGGEYSSIAVLKEDGSTVGMAALVIYHNNGGEVIREFKVE